MLDPLRPQVPAAITRLRRGGIRVHVVTGDNGLTAAAIARRAGIGVGVGMRRSGTDVAREAATTILTDDNFAIIAAAVESGRRIYDNVCKFICSIFTHAVPEVVPFLVFALAGGAIPLPLTVMQLLAIDLGTDVLPAPALSREPAEPGLMDRPPLPRAQGVISRPMLARAWGFLGLISAVLVTTGFYLTLVTPAGTPAPPPGPARHRSGPPSPRAADSGPDASSSSRLRFVVVTKTHDREAAVVVGSWLADSYLAGLGPALPRQVQFGSLGCCKISTIAAGEIAQGRGPGDVDARRRAPPRRRVPGPGSRHGDERAAPPRRSARSGNAGNDYRWTHRDRFPLRPLFGLAMFMQFLAGLDRIQSLGHQRLALPLSARGHTHLWPCARLLSITMHAKTQVGDPASPASRFT